MGYNDDPELVQALAAADAAGDTVAVRKLVNAIKTQRQQQANLGDMSGLDKFRAGMGRGFNDVGQGLKQLGLGVLDAMTPGMSNRKGAYTQQVDAERALYEPLRADSPVLTGAGRIVGNVAAMPIPAGRGASLLARTGSAALAGAAQGAVQYVPEGGSRAFNTTLGGTIGALIPGVIQSGKVTVGTVRRAAEWLKDLVPNMTASSREQLAAKILREAVANPANLAKLGQPSQLVPGTRQTLAEVTDDRGLAALQNTLSNRSADFKNQLGELAAQNNTARVEAIRGAFGGANEAAAQKLEAARNAATAPLLAAARKVKGVDTKPVVALANRIIKSREGNDTVVATISRVRDILARPGMDTVEKLHNARQEIGNILTGTAENQAGRAASRELLVIRQALDSQIGRASPEFRQFLKQFAAMSRDAGQVRMGDELLGKSAAALDPAGNPVLSAAQFARAANDLDRVAKTATGFRKESAERLMSQPQRDTVGAIRADLDRVARVGQAGTAIGSNTAQNLDRAGALRSAASGIEGDVKSAALSSVPVFGKVLDRFRQHYGDKVINMVQEIVLDPSRLQPLMASLSTAQQAQLRAAIQNPALAQAVQAFQMAAPTVAGASAAQQ